MRVFLTIVATLPPSFQDDQGLRTTWWTEEFDLLPGEALKDLVDEKIRGRIVDFPSSKKEERPNVISVCHSILP